MYSELLSNFLCNRTKLTCIDFIWTRRGAIVTTFIVCYAFTSIISGYVSGGMYSRMGGMQFCSFLFLTDGFHHKKKYWLLILDREKMDKVNDPDSFSISIFVLWNWLRLEHCCYILWVSSSYSIRHNGGCFCHLEFYLLPSGSSWYSFWKKLEWYSKQSMSCEDYSSSNSWEEVVPHTFSCFDNGRFAALW